MSDSTRLVQTPVESIAELYRRVRDLEFRRSGGGVYPVGVTFLYPGTTAPSSDWLLAQGQAVSRTGYPELFAVCGTAFGAGDGSTTFNLPDLRDRVPIGVGTNVALGAKGGTFNHVHTVDPPSTASSSDSHAHSLPNHVHNVAIAAFTSGGASAAATGNASSTGAFPGGTGFTATPQHTHSMAHTHSIDPPTTASGNPTTLPNTGSDSHSHTTDIAQFNSGTGNQAYQGINFIIRARP